MPQSYLALNIGPIYDTLNLARSTRAMWAGSYLFSYVMHDIAKGLKDNGVEFILPHFEGDLPSNVGLFPDRFICKGHPVSKVEDQITSVLKSLACKIAADLDKNKAEVFDFLKSYLNLSYITYETDDNPVLLGNRYLDAMELDTTFPSDGEGVHQILTAFLELGSKHNWRQNRKANNFLARKRNRFNSEEQKVFADTESIARGGLAQTGYLHQNYFAVVHADGDHIGKLIAQMYGNDSDTLSGFDKFSKCLWMFSKEASVVIETYGGFTIYAGGDDLLFFAPLIGKSGQDLLGMVSKLGDLFKDKLAENEELKPYIEKLEKKPTLSFGVAISYCKYPLREVMTASREQLFERAKNSDPNKNAIGFEVRKHSGQKFGLILKKDAEAFMRATEKLMQDVCTTFDENSSGNSAKNSSDNMSGISDNKSAKEFKLLSSLIHKLEYHLPVFQGMKMHFNPSQMEVHIGHWMDNNFNESIHKDHPFLSHVKALLVAAFSQEVESKTQDVETALQNVFAVLRYAQFLVAPNHN